jgi:hypothetical protein
MIHQIDAWVAALVFSVVMLACWRIGWRSGRLSPGEADYDPALKFTDASMALLGLLIAFSFAMAEGRHDQRRLMLVAESNAIGDFYTCASLLNEPRRSSLKTLIRTYAQNQIQDLSRFRPESEQRETVRKNWELQGRMTELVAAAITEGTPIALSLTNTLNEVTSANASRLAAYDETLPWSIQLLLLLAAGLPAFLTGRIQGASQKIRLPGTIGFIVLVTLAIFVTLDLNQGRRGLIQVSREPFERLLQSMNNDLANSDPVRYGN